MLKTAVRPCRRPPSNATKSRVVNLSQACRSSFSSAAKISAWTCITAHIKLSGLGHAAFAATEAAIKTVVATAAKAIAEMPGWTRQCRADDCLCLIIGDALKLTG